MSTKVLASPPHAGAPLAIGLRTVRGGAAFVAVGAADRAPILALSTSLAFAGGAAESGLYERSLERLHQGAERAVIDRDIAGARQAWAVNATTELGALVDALRSAGWAIARANLLVNRAGWIEDVSDYGLSSVEHARVAEGLAARQALRDALKAIGLATAETDEKGLPDLARAAGITAASGDAQLKAMGMRAGPPWRMEWKKAALAAWIAAISPN